MRAFIAAGLPEEMKIGLSKVSHLLDSPNIRVVRRENIHLTLAFIGSVDEKEIKTVKDSMERVTFAGFDAELTGLSCFGNPGAIYSSVTKGSDELRDLAALLRSELEKGRIKFDSKEFVPHVTLARIKRHVDDDHLKRLLERYNGYDFGRFRISDIALFSSSLGESGSDYTLLYEREGGDI